MENDRNTFPNALEAVFLVLALMMVEYLVACSLYDMNTLLGLSTEQLGALIVLLGYGLVFTVVMHYKGLSYRALFHSSSSSVTATVAVLVPAIVLTVPALLLVMQWLDALLVYYFPLSRAEEQAFAYFDSGTLAMLVVVCILAPVLEEMLFRGVILRSFLQQYPRWTAIVGSATLFGFAHKNLYQYVGGLIIGIFLGWLYERSKSLWPCIALHAVYNAGGQLAGTGLQKENFFLSSTWLSALLLGTIGVFLLRRVRLRN